MGSTRLQRAYAQLATDWNLPREGAEKTSESTAIERIWMALARPFRDKSGDCDPLQIPLIEEVTIWRLISFRLESALQGRVVLSESDQTVKPHPLLEAIAKARERYRRSLKELLGRTQPADRELPASLAEILQPILEEGADCVEESFVGEELSDDDEEPREIVRRVFGQFGNAPAPPGCAQLPS